MSSQAVEPKIPLLEDCAALAAVRDNLRILLRPIAEAELRDPPFYLSQLQSRLFYVEAQLANESCPQNDCARRTGEHRRAPQTSEGPIAVTIAGNLTELLAKSGRANSDWFDRTEDLIQLSPDIVTNPRGVVRSYLERNGLPEGTLTMTELARLTNADAIDYFQKNFPGHPLSPEGLEQLKQGVLREVGLYRLFNHAKTEAEIELIAREIGGALTPANQKRFLALMGQELNNGGKAINERDSAQDQYDEARAAFSRGTWTGANGAVTLLQMLDAYRTGDEKGVCRDNANGVAKMARLMGFRDVYVVHGQNKVPHTVTVMRDPEDLSRVYRCSYGKCSSVESRGTRALMQSEDLSTDYVVAEPDGKTVAVLPTDFKIAVHQALFGQSKDVDFFAHTEIPALAAIRVGNGRFQGNLVTGAEENGNHFVGVVGTSFYGDPSKNILAGQGGLGVFYRKSGTTDREYGQLYGTYTQNVNSRWQEPRPGIRFRVASATIGTVTVSATRANTQVDRVLPSAPSALPVPALPLPPPEYADVWQFGPFASLLSTMGPEVQYRSKDGRNSVNTEVKTQFGIGQSNPTNLDPTSLRPFHNLTYVSLAGGRQISPETRAMVDLAVGVRKFGWQGRVAGSLQNGTRRVTAGFEGALSPGAFKIAPGMNPEAFVRAGQTFRGGWRAELELRQDLNHSTLPRLNTKFQKSFGGPRR